MDIVLATSNPHKVEELRAIFAALALDVTLHGLKEFGALEEPAEIGTTFEQNATIKAISYAAQIGMPCLADDSGLEVDALGGRPGVISSHYCTDGREVGMSRPERDRSNNEKVLRELEGVPPEARSARFVCVMVLADCLSGIGLRPVCPEDASGIGLSHTTETSSPSLFISRGTMEGRIGIPPAVPRGLNGFGYDPLFLVAPDFACTGAELPPEEKNRLSHRGAAARAMAEQIRALQK